MELKRYVMDSTNTIYDLKKQSILGDGNKDGAGYLGYELKVGRNMRTTQYGEIVKTSDNILDLVEVGDLVGYIFWGEEYEHIEKKIDTQHIEYELKYNDIRYKITSIYKRQPNGDYKRYEAK